jgi:hypothetical protein
MGLETGTYIDSLNSSNPLGTDAKSAGDDHIRLIKSTVKATFPNLTGAVTADQGELNKLDGVTASTAELNYLVGVTSAIQAQLNGKQAEDADLTAIAALTTTATGRSLLAIADAAAGRTILASAAEASTQTIYIPAGAMKADPTAGPSIATVELANGPNITTLDFDTASDEHAQFAIRMPKGWNEGTVTFVPSWSHPATTTNFGVAWFLQAVAIGNDDTLNVAFGTAVGSVDTGGTTNDLYIGPASSAITIAGTPAAEDLVQFQIYRDVSDAGDTLAVDARLHGITVYYTTTSLSDA